MFGAKVDMELLAEFTASRSSSYKHGTPINMEPLTGFNMGFFGNLLFPRLFSFSF